MILLIITIALFISYSILIIYYWQGWRSIPAFIPGSVPAKIRLSVIIPARNEEKRIGPLLEALQHQTYPAAYFEVMVIDDHSDDNTAVVVRKFPVVKLISLQDDNINSYKKKAIETGISNATGDWIVTTDADCIPQPEWLQTIAAFIQAKDAVFIAAPVCIDCNNSLLEIFQALDFMILQGITGASVQKHFHSMSNGANQAYLRNAFHEVNGFKDVDHIASGDDLLLMHKIVKKFPGKDQYLKSGSAIVSTQPMKTWKEFFNQRIRWASKATHYADKRITEVLILVYLFNLSFLVLLVAGCWLHLYWYYLGALWIAKTIVEFPFVYSLSVFFHKKFLLPLFFFLQPLHIIYTIISGLFGQFGKYEWKGRRVR